MSVQPGSRLGPFEVLAEVGAGGMGKVYRARDTRLGRSVAIKVLPANVAADEEALARFEREARAIAALNHPHICVLHDVGREDGVDYLVMELVEGQTLAARLAAGPLPLEDALRFAIQIASALDRAHRAGIVHRDLKPGNIMVTSSGVKLLDFGLAKLQAPGAGPRGDVTRTTPLTGQGTILGTLRYMAPEQLEGREADAQTDIWAFGCVLYEMLTGRRTFEGDSQATVIASILKDTPRSITDLVPLAPPACDRIVRACLAKDPDERWQTARDLRRELEWAAGTSSASAFVPGAAAPPRRTPRLAWFTAAAATTVAAVFGGLWWSGPGAAPEPVEIDVAVPLRSLNGVTNSALSPDGRTLAYVARNRADARFTLHLRRLDSATPSTLPGTEGADKPF